MKHTVFRNFDKYGIKNLLKEIGAHRLNMECQNLRISTPTRLSLFYIESNDECVFLVYQYPQERTKIMKLDEYELPETGWVRVCLRKSLPT